MMPMLTEQEIRLLEIVQKGIPLVDRPYLQIAEEMGITEMKVIETIKKLQAEGYIRRIGGFFSSKQLGYQGELIALEVQPQHVAAVARFINKYPGVTHNYERTGRYNLWFTLIAATKEYRDEVCQEITNLPGVEAMLRAAARKQYKIKAQFKLRK